MNKITKTIDMTNKDQKQIGSSFTAGIINITILVLIITDTYLSPLNGLLEYSFRILWMVFMSFGVYFSVIGVLEGLKGFNNKQ